MMFKILILDRSTYWARVFVLRSLIYARRSYKYRLDSSAPNLIVSGYLNIKGTWHCYCAFNRTWFGEYRLFTSLATR